MKWIKVNTGDSGEGYELWADDRKLAGISFSKQTLIARVVSNIGKRLFFFEKKGILSSKALMKNEYGITMGVAEQERSGSKKGYMEFDGKRYCYILNENESGDLKLYDEEMKQSLLSCSFNSVSNGFAKTRSLMNTKFPFLLLVLCWYTFEPHTVARAEWAV